MKDAEKQKLIEREKQDQKKSRTRAEAAMRSALFVILCGTAFGAANDTFLIRNVDVYPVTSTPMQGVSRCWCRTARSPISARRSSRRRGSRSSRARGCACIPE